MTAQYRATIVGRRRAMAGVEVFKSNECQATGNPPPCSFSPSPARTLRWFLIRRRRRSFQVPGFLSNKGELTIVCLGTQVLG